MIDKNSTVEQVTQALKEDRNSSVHADKTSAIPSSESAIIPKLDAVPPDAFDHYLPLRPVRVAAGEYEIQTKSMYVLAEVEGSALAEWLCNKVNSHSALVAAESDALILTMDDVTAITISRALKVFSESLYSGDQAGRIQRGRADYIRAYIDEGIRSLATKTVTSDESGS